MPKHNISKRVRNLYTYTYQNNTKALLNHMFINKKLINSTLNSKAYFILQEYVPIIESSEQRYALVYAEIRNKQLNTHAMTYPHLAIVI